MAWNEPGGEKPRDPWRGGSGQGPDIDALIQRLRGAFNRLFGRGTGGGGGGLVIAAFGILLAWILIDSWTVIDAGQSGVVLRFGEYNRTMAPGFNLKWPRPIEQATIVKTSEVRSVSDSVRMLTNDENIVQVDFNVQYRVDDARQYLFNVRDPDDTLKEAAESAVREVVGTNQMDTILSGQGAQLVSDARTSLQKTLDSYDSGVKVTDVNFQKVMPPQEVQDAFDDVNNARENKQQFENEAQAYANNVVPLARGDAARVTAEAAGYKAQRIAEAQGDAQRFNLVEAQYKLAPDVTRKRLYLETMQQVVAATPKVIDLSGGKNLLYLPIGKAASSAGEAEETPPAAVVPAQPESPPASSRKQGGRQ